MRLTREEADALDGLVRDWNEMSAYPEVRREAEDVVRALVRRAWAGRPSKKARAALKRRAAQGRMLDEGRAN